MKIGLFFPIEDPKIWLAIRGAIQAARSAGVDLIVYGGSTEKNYQALDGPLVEQTYTFDPKQHDGILVAFAAPKLQAYVSALWQQKLPIMLFARRRDNVPSATSDNRETIAEAVSTFVEKGHRQIAFLKGPEGNYSAEQRLEGFLQGLRENGIEQSDGLILQGDFTERTGHSVMAKALAEGWHGTALIAANDLSAIGAIGAIHEAGLSPGADIEVLGFDNIPRAQWSKPPLSTFDPRLYRMGYQACEELIKCIRGDAYTEHITIPTCFVPRSSTWEASQERSIDRPLMAEWMADSFYYEVQLETLKRDHNASSLINQLTASIDTPETFIQTFRELLDVTRSLGFSAICLSPILMELEKDPQQRAGHLSIVLGTLIDKLYGIQSAAVFDEQKRLTEIALRFGSSTSKLRELSFSAVKEETILSTFRATLQSLEIARAGVYLYTTPFSLSQPGSTAGVWHSWSLNQDGDAEAATGMAKDRFDISLLGGTNTPGNWLYLPLLYDEELYGLVTLDLGTDFLTQYTDLVRLFSVALRSARMQEQLSKASAELLETSRMAGVAEMATGILHNIGNALNSVNTSCSLVSDKLRKSRLPSLGKATQLIRDNEADLGKFLSNDPRGQKLPAFLSQLAEHLGAEQVETLREMDTLREKVDHINQIVAAQQSYAHVSAVDEQIPPEELLDMALKLSEASLVRHQVRLERQISKTPPVRVQRQKAVQILVNLIRNAKEAMGSAGQADKVLSLEVSQPKPGMVLIGVRDNGLGITPENAVRIFAFGFSTKKGGHGFGLHNSALAAKEMGGSLRVESEGPGKGACFLLELPAG